jgi:hypothetical protein
MRTLLRNYVPRPLGILKKEYMYLKISTNGCTNTNESGVWHSENMGLKPQEEFRIFTKSNSQ